MKIRGRGPPWASRELQRPPYTPLVLRSIKYCVDVDVNVTHPKAANGNERLGARAVADVVGQRRHRTKPRKRKKETKNRDKETKRQNETKRDKRDEERLREREKDRVCLLREGQTLASETETKRKNE